MESENMVKEKSNNDKEEVGDNSSSNDHLDESDTAVEHAPPKPKSSKFSLVIANVVQSRLSNVRGIVKAVATKTIVGVGIWLLGFFGFSIAWVLLAVGGLVYMARIVEKRKRTSLLMSKVQNDKKALVEAVKQIYHEDGSLLPAWINFPDVEKAEWINKIIHQLWPSIQGFVRDILADKVAPAIHKSSKMLSDFEFTDMDLGSHSPQIVGVKVYGKRNTRSDEIIIDLQLIWDSNCNIGVIMNHMKAGIRDLHFRGLLRIQLQPLLRKKPIVGAVAVSFVGDPVIDYNLTELANLFDFPGLDSTLLGAISEGVRGLMVYPQKYVQNLCPDVDVSDLRYPLPMGIVRIFIIKAKDLEEKDRHVFGSSSSDPYVVVDVGRNSSYKTAVIKETTNPVWNEVFDVVVDEIWRTNIDISLFDYDGRFNKPDKLGIASLPVKAVYEHGVIEEWFTLSNVVKGSVLMRFEWHDFSSNSNDLILARAHLPEAKVAEVYPAFLKIYVDGASSLPNISGDSSHIHVTPQLKIAINGKKTFKTKVSDNSKYPVWEENFSTLLADPENTKLLFQVDNDYESYDDKELGDVELLTSRLLPEKNMCLDQDFSLKYSGRNSSLKMKVSLHILKLKVKSGKQFDYKESVRVSNVIPHGEPTIEDKTVVNKVTESAAAAGDDGTSSDDAFNDDVTLLKRSNSMMSLESTMSEILAQRKRLNNKAGGELGRIQLTVRSLKNRISVVVVKAENLIVCDEDNGTSDPYVKVRVVGEKRAKKTKTVKKNLNPTFDQLLQFHIESGEVRRRKLKVVVKNETGFLSSEKVMMGEVVVDMAQFSDLTQPTTKWYELRAEDS